MILEAARLRRQQESGRHGGREGGSKGGGTDSEGYGRGREHWCAETETGYAQVGGLYCEETRWTSVEGMPVQEGSSPHRKDIGRRGGRSGRENNKYVTISNRA